MSRINQNISSMVAQRTLGSQNMSLNKSLQRLSTGLRINRGAADPAGLMNQVAAETGGSVVDTTGPWKTFKFTDIRDASECIGYEVTCYAKSHRSRDGGRLSLATANTSGGRTQTPDPGPRSGGRVQTPISREAITVTEQQRRPKQV